MPLRDSLDHPSHLGQELLYHGVVLVERSFPPDGPLVIEDLIGDCMAAIVGEFGDIGLLFC